MTKYPDRYIRENYVRLAKTFREHETKLNEKGYSPLDKLNDTMLTLYESEEIFLSYEEFCQWAGQKFGNRTRRRKRRCLKRVQNIDS